jgi:hypothetical protein
MLHGTCHMSRALILLLLVSFAVPARAADPVVIVAPEDGDTVPPRFTVKVMYGELSVCEDECYDLKVDSVSLYAGKNAVLIDNCFGCPPGGVDFEVSFEPGPHLLYAIASASFVSKESNHIEIEVVDASTTDGPAPDSEGKDGCSCELSGSGASDLRWLGVVGLGLLRRRGRACAGFTPRRRRS